ncbi:MAG: DUF6498-containing protein [Anaerolineae bacterium]|nr:DUF6498-containing protein [Anaerolineae bacterium]
MRFIQSLILPLLINAIPALGFLFGAFGTGNTMLIYWAENLLGGLMVAVRIWLHRRWTQKQGHYRAHVNTMTTTTTRRGGRVTQTRQIRTTFLAEFMLTHLVFTLAHGVFLVFLLFVMRVLPDRQTWLPAIASMAFFQSIALVMDVVTLKYRPFAWVKRLANGALGRMALVHLALIFGVGLAAVIGKNELFFVPFAALKLLVDVGSYFLKSDQQYAPAPSWLANGMNKLKPGHDFAAELEADRQRLLREAELDEQVIPARSASTAKE